jgi:hypothetical protein
MAYNDMEVNMFKCKTTGEDVTCLHQLSGIGCTMCKVNNLGEYKDKDGTIKNYDYSKG